MSEFCDNRIADEFFEKEMISCSCGASIPKKRNEISFVCSNCRPEPWHGIPAPEPFEEIRRNFDQGITRIFWEAVA